MTMNGKVISVFAGLGKTTVGNKYSNVCDLQSSPYRCDYSMIDIANRPSFSSQSHFIQQFREVEGITPKKYRDEYYMVQWDLQYEDDTTDKKKNMCEE